MEAQWHKLRTGLTSTNVEEMTNPFYRRLLLVLADSASGSSDKAKAYYDALASALVNGVDTPSLPIVDQEIRDRLISTGLTEHRILSDEVRLNEEEKLVLDKDVYGLKQKRFLKKPIMDVALSALLQDKEFSHYNGLGQQTAIRVALTSPDDSTLFINLPTGCGKTLLIHALMLMTPSHRLNLVVVPTVALAIEQGERVAEILKNKNQYHGGPYAWYGSQSEELRSQLRDRLRGGTQRILFCSPEAVKSSLLPVLFQLAKNDQLGALIVDEAHLVDQWGAGFRPDFQLLAPLVQSLQGVAPRGIRKILMSATFSPATLKTLKNIFVDPGHDPIEINANFLRPEPSYYITQTRSPQEHEQQVLIQLRRLPRPLILYATKVEDAIWWYDVLLEHGYKRIGLFHGDTSTSRREELIKKWRSDQLDIMVGTSAFGVGMDKSDVRSVLHVAVPENLDRYYQECGRGGRDGKASIAHLIYFRAQIAIAENINKERLISTELGHKRWFYIYQSREPISGSETRFRVDLTTQHKEIHYNSRRNIAWNWRTLLLMKRAGFIELFFTEPYLPQEGSVDEKKINEYYQDYFSHVEVQIIHDGHLDHDVWNKVVGAQRLHEHSVRLSGFSQLNNWLTNPYIKLCGLLSDFYAGGGYVPENACGGCPGCRAQKCEPFTPTLGSMVQPVAGWSRPKGDSIGKLQRIHYNGKGQHARVLIHKWKRLIVFLLQRGIVKAIRTRSEVHTMLNNILSVNNFWCALAPDEPDSIWDELVLVMPDEVQVPMSGFSNANKIFFIPDHLPDPFHPQRIWVNSDQQTVSIEDYERSLSYVDN